MTACGAGDGGREGRPGNLQGGPLRPATPPPEHVVPKSAGTPPANIEEQTEGTRVIGLTASDEKRLSGRLFGDSGDRTRGIVLLHGSDSDRTAWTPFAERLMDDGFAVFTLEFRGYGQSDGPRDPTKYPKDVVAALDALRVFGVTDVVIAGREVGGTAAVALPQKSASGVKGIVTVGSTSTFEELDVKEEARALKTRALVIIDQGEDSDLAELIPDAASASIAFGDQPEASDQVTARIKQFVDDVL